MGHKWELNNNCDNKSHQDATLIYILGLIEKIDWDIDPQETLGWLV